MKEDTFRPHKLLKFEALLNFSNSPEEQPQSSYDYITEAVSLLTDKAGISLEDSRRVTIYKDDEGTICVSIVPSQKTPEPANEGTRTLEALFEEKIETSLLEMLSKGNIKTDTLVTMARSRYGTELLWKMAFRFLLRHLEEHGEIVSAQNDNWEITEKGRARLWQSFECAERRR